MEYYTNSKNYKFKHGTFVIIVVFTILIFINFLLYLFDRKVYPAVLEMSKSKVSAKTVSTISETAIDLFNNEFNYDEMIIIDRDSNNNINLIRTNNIKLNYLASKLNIECNKKLQDIGKVGIAIPLTWVTENKAFYNLGPKINIKIEPIGNMNIEYESHFESAGINQTRHTINLIVICNVKIVMPLKSEEMEVKTQIPVAETIIVGKIPDTSINLNN
ncbi:MAG: sporulation protein YunB [Clostridiales bacterium]|nr:sporulation protein YunB [Clostridiales bacterium]